MSPEVLAWYVYFRTGDKSIFSYVSLPTSLIHFVVKDMAESW